MDQGGLRFTLGPDWFEVERENAMSMLRTTRHPSAVTGAPQPAGLPGMCANSIQTLMCRAQELPCRSKDVTDQAGD